MQAGRGVRVDRQSTVEDKPPPVGTNGGHVFAVDAQTGRQKWSHHLGKSLNGTVAVNELIQAVNAALGSCPM